MRYHQPVMAAEALEALHIQPDGVYVDATYGGGGHARLILASLGSKGRLIAFDQDEDASANVLDDPRLVFVPHNFRDMKKFLRLHGFKAVDGILADLGVSSHQFDEAERGFSFRSEYPLDMRMDKSGSLDAIRVLNSYPEEELLRILSAYGEVRNARTLARRIVEMRGHREIKTTPDLLAVLEPLIRGQRERYLAQVFQALRIEVNDEMGALEAFLGQAIEVLKPGGRLVVISYHSIEDRLVKHFMKAGNASGEPEHDFYGNIYRPFQLVSKKAVEPGAVEIAQNPRSRSAKLRAAVK